MACSSFSGQTKDKPEQFQYVTKNLVNQEFELEARAKLVKIKNRIKLQTVAKQTRVKAAALSLSTEFLRTKLSDVIHFLGNPHTTKEFVKRVEDYASETAEGSENSDNQTTDHNLNMVKGLPPKTPKASRRVLQAQAGSSSSTTKFIFPNITELRNPLKTPLNHMIPSSLHTPMFSFGNGVIDGGNLPSTIKKTPRPAKPGEPIFTFSATGSPVIQTTASVAVPASICRSARMKVDDGNGKVIDVDLVYRGKAEDEKNFGKIVTDFRCFVATRSAMSTNRMLPSRVIVAKKRTKSLVGKYAKRR